jgi:hypothetical protein
MPFVRLNKQNAARRVTSINDALHPKFPPGSFIFGVSGGIMAQDNAANGVKIGVEGHGVFAGVYGVANGDDAYGIVGNGAQAGLFVGSVLIKDDLTLGEPYFINATDNAYLHCSANLDGCVEDYGRASLIDGMAVVPFHRDFWQMTDTSPNNYHVFLTPLGDCNGLYLDKKTLAPIDPENYFIVRELQDGKSNVEFAYHVVAPRIIKGVTINAPRDYSPPP